MKKIGSLISNSVLIIGILIALFLLIPLIPVADQWYQLAIVQSASMEPFLAVGNLAIYQPRKNYRPGEVIVYQAGDGKEAKTIIHRIVQKNKSDQGVETYLTQGDATAYLSAQPVFAGQIQGKLVGQIPKIGYVFNWLQSPIGIALVVLIPMVFLSIYELTQLP